MTWGDPLPSGGHGWQGWGALIALLGVLAYWVLLEWALGATIGKYVFGLRVLSVHGRACTFDEALRRNLLRAIDFLFLYFLGFVVAMLNRKRQRLGDLWAGTLVVTTETYRSIRAQAQM